MPLIHNTSKAAFKENVSEMRHSGHPLKQALAAAYQTQRDAQRDSHEEREAPKHAFEALKYGQ